MRDCLFLTTIALMLSFVALSQPKRLFFEEEFAASAIPFERIIKTPIDSLTLMGFRYDRNKNMYKYIVHSKETKRAKLWEGTTIRTGDDFEMYLYMGTNRQLSIIQVSFYSPLLYGAIKKWIEQYKRDFYHVASERAELYEFRSDSLAIRLVKDSKRVTDMLTESSFGIAASPSDRGYISPVVGFSTSRRTNSYPIYVYTVFLPIQPDSRWFREQQQLYLRNRSKKVPISSLL